LRGPELCESAKANFCVPQRRTTLLALKQYSELIQSNPEALKSAFAHQAVMGSTLDLAKGCLEHHIRQGSSNTVQMPAIGGAAQ
jgi:hypothetical protein